MFIDKEYLQDQLGLPSSSLSNAVISNEDKAFKKIERLVSVRDRAVSEVTERLIREGYTSAEIERAVQRALSCGYLDDVRFADTLIRSRLNNGKGMVGIERELKLLGINIESVPGWPDEYLNGSPDQVQSALQLLIRKPPHAKNKRNAAFAKLIRSGYSTSIASQAVKKWMNMLSE